MRIAFGSLFQESNTFTGVPTRTADFAAVALHDGAAVLGLREDTSEVGGALTTLRAAGVEIVPLLVARAAPGGALAAECWSTLRDRLVADLRAAGPVDAVVLALHGAMAAEGVHDPEGELLAEVRALAGDGTPVVASLDMHAHVTEAMVQFSQALFPYRQYPHTDAWDTGVRAARCALRLAAGGPAPGMTMVKIPQLTNPLNARTVGDGPLVGLSARARALEAGSGVEELCIVLVQPHIDVPDSGHGVLAVGGAAAEREQLARELVDEFWQARFALNPLPRPVREAVEIGRRAGGTVVLVDSADCVGGGSIGDTVGVLAELMALGVEDRVHVPVVDPAAAAQCLRAGAGARVELRVGHGLDPQWGEPLAVSGTVLAVEPDARFTYTGGIFGGVETTMGATAVVHVEPGFHLMIMTRPTYDWRDEQFRRMGLDAAEATYVVAKNPGNHHMAYGEVATAFVPVDVPGPTTARLDRLTYRRGARSSFPFAHTDPDAPMPEPVVHHTDGRVRASWT